MGQVSSTDLRCIYFGTLFDNIDAFHILTKILFARNKFCLIESGMLKKTFLYSKIGLAPV